MLILRTPPQLHRILAEPRHYQDVSLSHLPRAHQCTLAERLPALLPGTRHLVLRSFPASTLSALLPACSDRLTTLDLSFSSVSDHDLALLARQNGRRPSRPWSSAPLINLRSLKLKGCRRISDFLTRIFNNNGEDPDTPDEGGGEPILSRLTCLDLSWSSVASLPLPLAARLPALASFSVSTTPYLSRQVLVGAISSLPESMTELDLSHLSLTVKDLSNLAFVAPLSHLSQHPPELQESQWMNPPLELPPRPRPLRLVLAGNDHLTVSSLAFLERHWSATLPSPQRLVEIEHGGLMLESDEEEDVRRFVEMVAGVIMREGRNSSDRGEPSDTEVGSS